MPLPLLTKSYTCQWVSTPLDWWYPVRSSQSPSSAAQPYPPQALLSFDARQENEVTRTPEKEKQYRWWLNMLFLPNEIESLLWKRKNKILWSFWDHSLKRRIRIIDKRLSHRWCAPPGHPLPPPSAPPSGKFWLLARRITLVVVSKFLPKILGGGRERATWWCFQYFSL